MNARVMPRVLILVVLAAAAGAAHFVIGPRPAEVSAIAGPGEITVADAKSLATPVIWVDARPREKFDAGHIRGAMLLNGFEWDTLAPIFLDAWDPGSTIIVYCDGGTCTASHEIADRIRAQFELPDKVVVLKGGWEAWQSAR